MGPSSNDCMCVLKAATEAGQVCEVKVVSKVGPTSHEKWGPPC